MSEPRPILYATDGSPSAAEAQREAFELAELYGAPLLVVSVAHPALPAVGYAAYGYSEAVAEMTRAEHERVEALVAAVAKKAGRSGLTCQTFTCGGLAVEEICRVASERDARLIVVGAHGWSAARRLLSGSVSTGLVHSAPCPVLVVRPRPSAAERAAAA